MRNSLAPAVFAAFAAAFTLAGCPRSAESPPPSAAAVELDVPRVGASAGAGIVGGEPTDPNAVRFGRESAKVGARSHQHVLARSLWNEQHASYESEFVIEVLAIEGASSGGWPSRVKIEFRKNESFDNVSHQATSIDGHTYLVDVHAPHVLDAATNAVPSEDEVARVTDVLPDLGTRAQIDQILPDTAMRIGEHRDDIAKAIARILHPRIWNVDQGSAVLARTEQGEAVFQVALDATSSATKMKIAIKGDARVRLRDARLEGFALAGEFVRPNGERGELHVERTVRDD
jgi:hypothetical protein